MFGGGGDVCNKQKSTRYFKWNKNKIKTWKSFSYLICNSSDFSELSMDMTKRLMNHVREYWYIGSILARSAIEKNRMDEWIEIGRYSMRVASIFFSVSSATACFSEISFAKALEDDSILMAVSSSKMFPSEEERTSKILSSISFSCL